MSRYIDADKLIEDLEHDIAIDQDHILYFGTNMEEKESIQFDKDCKQNCIDMLSKAPTADVVEVVRCNDCKHYKDNHRCYSKYSNMNDYRSPTDYCSYAERTEK